MIGRRLPDSQIPAPRAGDGAWKRVSLTLSFNPAEQRYRVNQLTNYRPAFAGSQATLELPRYGVPSGR